MSVITPKPITKRDPGPYAKGRTCPACGAQLRTTNPGPYCDPCFPNPPKLTDQQVRADRQELFEELMAA